MAIMLHSPHCLLRRLFLLPLLLLVGSAAGQRVAVSISLDQIRSNFSSGACDGRGGGAHIFIDRPLVHFPTLFFSIDFHDKLSEHDGYGDAACLEGSCSSRDGSSVHFPIDSTSSDGIISISRKMTLSVEYEINDSGRTAVLPLYSLVYNTNWDGRATAGDDWVIIRSGGQPGVPVLKAQDLPVTMQVEDLMAMPQWPELMTIESGLATSSEVKLFYLLEFDVKGGDHVILSLELHACPHADWRSTWNNIASSSSTSSTSSSTTDQGELPAEGLQHVEGRDLERSGEEGEWSHYKCSAGKQWFDDAEVGSASSTGMHAESARHIMRWVPQPLHARRAHVTRGRRVCMFSALCMTPQGKSRSNRTFHSDLRSSASP